ncbi:MAG: shikimate kinase [Ruminococcus sp.]|nr:shikimate kinase [Ruminococcus sp.]
MNAIALCGFMGCGKTTVALALEKKYNLRHIDTDRYIEEKENMTINEMFENFSEGYFRDKEFDAICTLSKEKGCVLALGGGAVTFERNVKSLKENGYTLIFLDTDFEVIKKRLMGDKTRPLLKSNDIETLYKKRYPIYENACDVKITCFRENAEEICDKILEILKKEGKNP